MKTKCKKVVAILMALVLCSMWSICLATETEKIAEEFENSEYITNYEDYAEIANTATEYTQDELKDYYVAYQDYMRGYYQEYQRADMVRAKVIEVADVVEEYQYDELYYSVSKYEVQPIKVRILEGEDAGEEYAIKYLLTGDSLGNIKYAELNEGNTIFVCLFTDSETGETYADISNTGANVDRFSIVVCIGIIALILLMIYGRKKGLLTALTILLVLDFCLVIIPTMGFDGQGFLLGGISFIVLLITAMVVSKLGLNKKAIKAGCVSLGVTAVTALFLWVAQYLTRVVGITFEIAAIAENVVMGNMNFEHLYIMITMIIAAWAITDAACKTAKKLEETSKQTFNERLEFCKDTMNDTALGTAIILLATYIPNHLLLLTNKYTATEIWNAEILASELIRIFVVIMGISLTVPAVVAISEPEKSKK